MKRCAAWIAPAFVLAGCATTSPAPQRVGNPQAGAVPSAPESGDALDSKSADPTPGAHPPTTTQEPASVIQAGPECQVDLRLAGMMSDAVSNALIRALGRPEVEVAAYLAGAKLRYASGQELLRAAAVHFQVDETQLAVAVERFRHDDCDHGPIAATPGLAPDYTRPAERPARPAPVALSDFARDVTLHVVLHELGHALIREFDLPVLGNEETMADAFATHYLTTQLPERAAAVLRARTTSLMIEAREVSREEWPVHGEHDSDARRAFQIAALAVAADPARYQSVAESVAMSERDLQKAQDYGAEIHRAWRRILGPLWMPDGLRSKETRVVCDAQNEFSDALVSTGLQSELESILGRFDWHSQVTLRFAAGDGSAGWSRSERTIKVSSGYLRRFVAQGEVAGP